MTVRRRLLSSIAASAVAAIVVLTASRALGAQGCDASGADSAAVAAARGAVQGSCDCEGAARPADWRRCVRDVVLPLVDGGTLSAACGRHVRRVENRSTCGRTGIVVCCVTSATGRTMPRLRKDGRCTAPPAGSACESEWAYLDDGCTADGCTPLPPCGDGVVEAPETCDPPDGTTCNTACSSCAAEPGTILLGCTEAPTNVDAAATSATFLVGYTDLAPSGSHRSVARRLEADGTILDATPLEVSATLPGTSASGGFTQGAAGDGDTFYVAWNGFAEFVTYFGGRRIPASGPITDPPEVIASNFAFGFCSSNIAGPINLAPTLDSTGFHKTWRVVFYCGADVLFEVVVGVGDFFTVPPPGHLSFAGAPLARGANDVAGVWLDAFIPSLTPPIEPVFSIRASWIAPGSPEAITLTSGTSTIAPALAATGDVFLAVWAAKASPADASPTEIRALRFTRAAGPLDPDGGFLVATAAGAIGDLAAASNGGETIIAWREATTPGASAIRAIRVATDGSIPDPTPISVAVSDASASVSIAANPAAALVAFTRAEAVGRSVRAAVLGD